MNDDTREKIIDVVNEIRNDILEAENPVGVIYVVVSKTDQGICVTCYGAGYEQYREICLKGLIAYLNSQIDTSEKQLQ